MVYDEVLAALTTGDERTLKQYVDPKYVDSLGGASELFEDIRTWNQIYERRSFTRTGWNATPNSLSRATALATTTIEAEFVGTGHSVRVSGTMALEFIRHGHFRVQSGLFTRLRDALELVHARRRALEANDVEQLQQLIHPQYRQGHTNRLRLLQSLRMNMKNRSVRIEPIAYYVELRRQLVHVDEHYTMSINGQKLPPSVARLTLTPSAGRLKIRSGLGDTAASSQSAPALGR